MIEHEWWDHETPEAMAAAVAGDIHYILSAAIAGHGRALAILPGGPLSERVLAHLAAMPLDWGAVTLVPSDDAVVPPEHADSAAGRLSRAFGPLGAKVIPLAEAGIDPAESARAADARLRALDWAPDLALLEIGDGGEVAAIRSGPDLRAALEAPHLVVAVRPGPSLSGPTAPRVTLTRAALLAADAITFAIEGGERRRLLARAIADGPSSRVPVGRLLAGAEHAIDLHWCP